MSIVHGLKRCICIVALVGFAVSPTVVGAQEDVLKAEFKEIRQTGFGLYGIYSLTNTSGKDIDDIELHIFLQTADGESLSSTALTDTTPGLVWQKAAETIEIEVPLDGRPAAKAALEKNPDDTILAIKVRKITYMQ